MRELVDALSRDFRERSDPGQGKDSELGTGLGPAAEEEALAAVFQENVAVGKRSEAPAAAAGGGAHAPFSGAANPFGEHSARRQAAIGAKDVRAAVDGAVEALALR